MNGKRIVKRMAAHPGTAQQHGQRVQPDATVPLDWPPLPGVYFAEGICSRNYMQYGLR